MNYLQKLFTLIKLLPLAITLSQPAGAQTISDTDKRTNAHGDHGYWQSGQPDVMILWPQDQQNIVKRFTGNAQHPYPYRLWVDSGRAGGFPVVLKTSSTFNNFLEHIKASPDKDWCQLAEIWTNWQGSAPTACGTHSYTQQRNCSIATNAVKPCPDLCNPAAQTRSRSVDNGPCEPPAPPEKQCSTSAWIPGASTVCAGQRFTQTRTLADCSTERRTVTGSKSCPNTCTLTTWSPDAGSVCAGQRFTQTRTLSDCSAGRRTAIGSKSCPRTCRVSAWSPGRDTTCSGDTLTQTRTLSDCSSDQRTVSGTRSCPSSCTPTSWTPSANTVCSGKTLTQTRTLGNCSTDSRSATGTKYCPQTCKATSWNPATGTVCSGKQFTQTRTLSNCSSDSRSATGTKHCPPTCKTTSWSPATGTVCSGEKFTQTRTLSDCSSGSRTATGAKSCPRNCTVTGWQPPAGTVCTGSSFTQTRTLKNCSTDNRSARGTRCCGRVTQWRPDPATKCGTFTQARTNACGKAESRSAKGTASWCGCSWGPYTPSPGTVCKGKTFTQKSYYSCSGRTNKPRTRTTTGTKSCQKAECRNGQSYCSAYKRYLCRNGKWKVIAEGPYACFTP
ncbi:MAG: hypothetical protein OXG54_05590 [Gammaproteobacteria bacterium]|nr:hypothetical protein [Gammaproteobacteria bacterium]